MALTITQICNLALSELGEYRNQISDYATGTDNISVQCRLHYPRALAELTRMHTWNCGILRDQLSTTAYTEHGWDYYAALPSDCIRVLNVTDVDTTYWNYDDRIKWKIENGNILINYTDPYIEYMAEPTLANMDSLFTQALYTYLAAKLAVPLKGGNGRNLRAALLDEFFSVVLPAAKRVDGFEEDDIEPIESDFLEAHSRSFYNNEYPFNQSL